MIRRQPEQANEPPEVSSDIIRELAALREMYHQEAIQEEQHMSKCFPFVHVATGKLDESECAHVRSCPACWRVLPRGARCRILLIDTLKPISVYISDQYETLALKLRHFGITGSRALMTDHPIDGRETNKIEALLSKTSAEPGRLHWKLGFNALVVFASLIMLFVDLWAISQGLVATEPQRNFATLVAVGSFALLLVGMLSVCSLVLSVVAYQRLQLLMERAEKERVVEEGEALLSAVHDALQETDEPSRNRVLAVLKEDDRVRKRSARLEEIKQLIGAG